MLPPPDTAEMATGRDLLPQVDRNVDMAELSVEAMIQTFVSDHGRPCPIACSEPGAVPEVLRISGGNLAPRGRIRSPAAPSLGAGSGS